MCVFFCPLTLTSALVFIDQCTAGRTGVVRDRIEIQDVAVEGYFEVPPTSAEFADLRDHRPLNAHHLVAGGHVIHVAEGHHPIAGLWVQCFSSSDDVEEREIEVDLLTLDLIEYQNGCIELGFDDEHFVLVFSAIRQVQSRIVAAQQLRSRGEDVAFRRNEDAGAERLRSTKAARSEELDELFVDGQCDFIVRVGCKASGGQHRNGENRNR
jgi:hypothetical protein